MPRRNPDLRITPAPYFDSKTGIYFPGSIGFLHRQSVVQLEEKSPGLGAALSYRDTTSKLDIFTYDLKAPLIPTGIDSTIVKNSFTEGISNIQKADTNGIYSNLKITSTDTITIAAQEFLHAQFSYGENLLQKDAHLFISGVNGQILKFRVTLTNPSKFNIERAIQILEIVILQSRRNGYNGITQKEFTTIEQALGAINLTNGLAESEAIAIAQMKLINEKYHTQFNPTKGEAIKNQETGVFTIQFQSYPTDRNNTISIEINPDGSATLPSKLIL